ncbi:MAG: restriction endonuclease subunit S, partial [Clostridiales bacterium]|nr:restriction endonuclease subunit S [Clostridiales bacterium]
MKYNTVKLGDISWINTESYSSKENWTFVNYLDTGNITENMISEIQYIKIEEEKLPSRAKRKVKYNSIIYSTVRPNQKHYGIIKEQPDNFLVSTGFAVIDIDTNKANADYIYFVLTQENIIEYLHTIAEQSTSTYPSIKPLDLKNIEILLPSLEEQEKIASILTLLNRKIDINMRINNNLP